MSIRTFCWDGIGIHLACNNYESDTSGVHKLGIRNSDLHSSNIEKISDLEQAYNLFGDILLFKHKKFHIRIHTRAFLDTLDSFYLLLE